MAVIMFSSGGLELAVGDHRGGNAENRIKPFPKPPNQVWGSYRNSAFLCRFAGGPLSLYPWRNVVRG